MSNNVDDVIDSVNSTVVFYYVRQKLKTQAAVIMRQICLV